MMNSLKIGFLHAPLAIVSIVLIFVGATVFADEYGSETSQGASIQSACAAKTGANAKLADLSVTITGLRNTKGHILASVYSEVCGGFPDQDRLAFFNTQTASAEGVNFVVKVPPGNYAIAVLQDANDNKKMDTFAGVPKEGFGFSNNAMKPFGPPSFEQAKIVVPANGAATSIKIKYML